MSSAAHPGAAGLLEEAKVIELSKDLLPIYDYELSNGNEVIGIDEEVWTRSPLVVWFRYPLTY